MKHRFWLCVPGAMALALAAGGCRTAGFSGVEFSRKATQVEASAFAEPGSAAPQNARSRPASAPADSERPRTLSVSRPIDSVSVSDERLRDAPRISAREASGGLDPAQVRALTEQEEQDAREAESDQAAPAMLPMTVVDAKVGDINGKAIYASAVFRNPDAALRATARRVRQGEMSREEWIQRTSQTLATTLQEMLREELVRAEAISKLPSEQRRFGVRGFLDLVREGEARRAGGVTTAARRRVEDPDRTYEEYLERRGAEMIVQELLFRPLMDRTSVPWRLIEDAYRRRFDEFNPGSTVTFRVIRINERSQESVEVVKLALEEGVPFAEVASGPHNGFISRTGDSLQVFDLNVPFEEAEFYRFEEVNEAIRGLTVGEWAGPVRGGSFYFWFLLEEFNQRSIPLIDAQRALRTDLESDSIRQSEQELIERLVRRASFTELEVMHRRLMEIAIQRYLPPEQGRNGGR